MKKNKTETCFFVRSKSSYIIYGPFVSLEECEHWAKRLQLKGKRFIKRVETIVKETK